MSQLSQKFHVIIPARYQSTRLPAKPLSIIGDKPMIVHVCERAVQSGALSVTVATDHDEILQAVKKAGYNAVLTKINHPSGSDRVFEAAELIGLNDDDVIVNVQGDEPFIPYQNIQLVASLINSSESQIEGSQMATLCCPIDSAKELIDPNIVKVIFNLIHKAIFFSRSVIPFNRDNPIKIGDDLTADYYRHIGIYSYTKKFLKQFIAWPQSQLEKTEALEQLRVIENGYAISIATLNELPPHGVDTKQDLENARQYYFSLSDDI